MTLAFDADVLAIVGPGGPGHCPYTEYRTQFHVGKSYGIHEANANRIIRKVEGTLAASGVFNLPGKRAARSDEGVGLSFVTVDVTETPIEKPENSRGSATAAKSDAVP